MTAKSDDGLRSPTEADAVYQGFIERLLRIFMAIQFVALVLVALRMYQFPDHAGLLAIHFFLLLISLGLMLLLPPRLIRARIFVFLLVGLLLCALGIYQAGLATSALPGVPVLIIAAATLTGTRVALCLLAVFGAVFAALAVAFSTGRVVATFDSAAYSAQPLNWVSAGVVVALGAGAGIILVHMLRTHWVRAARDSRRQYEQFRALIDYAPEGVLVYDVDRNVLTEVNPKAAEFLRRPREEIVNRLSLSDLNASLADPSNPDAKTIARHMQTALNGGEPHFEWQHRRPDGTVLPCDVSVVRLPHPDRRLLRACIVDTTERKTEERARQELTEQLTRSQKLEAIGKLTGGVAHDFNNLLAVILGNLELLRDEVTDAPNRALIDAAIGATQKGADLTRYLLRYARRAPLSPEVIDLNAVVRETGNWTARTLPSSIAVETSLLAGLWRARVDPGATESALLNLMLNARDAMPDGGKLTIETSNVRVDRDYVETRSEEIEPGRYVLLAVSDTGQGIPRELQERIFDPFFTTKPPGSGSGLGLSMIQGFMRQSGGAVRVYSEAGAGSTFKLYFPAVFGPEEQRGLPPARGGDGPSRGYRILLVEDEKDVLGLLTTTLVNAGHIVWPAHSGDEARRVFDTDPDFDLLLTDIVMPGRLQGTGLARELRATRPALPVIFLSGYAAEATVHGNGLRPEDIRLMKPVGRAELLDAVRRAMAGPADDAPPTDD